MTGLDKNRDYVETRVDDESRKMVCQVGKCMLEQVAKAHIAPCEKSKVTVGLYKSGAKAHLNALKQQKAMALVTRMGTAVGAMKTPTRPSTSSDNGDENTSGAQSR